jgi:hypothetical protein
MLKKIDKYNYNTYRQINDQGPRTYDVNGIKLPSVTTILDKTKNKEFLKNWIAKKGEKEAERIKNLSSKRGTSMHKYLENYIINKGYEDLTELGQQAKSMAQKVIEVGLLPVSSYYGSEVTLHYPGLYAGSTDLVGVHNDMDTIIDFKQSNRPKIEEWVDDYKLQIAMYAMAHDYVYGSNIRQGLIMICTPDLYYQEFKIQDAELRNWKHKALKRVNEYYQMIHEEYEDEKNLEHGSRNMDHVTVEDFIKGKLD